MRLDPSQFGPAISIIVVAHIGEQQTSASLVDDNPDVATDAHRPEIRVF